MTEQNTTRITADEVRAYRAALKAHREAQRAEKAARRERREERAEEIKRHREAAAQAQHDIDMLEQEIDTVDTECAEIRSEIAQRRVALSKAEAKRKEQCALREIAYANRNAAKSALVLLNMEIRGSAFDEDAAAAEARVCEAEYRGDPRGEV